MQFTFATLFILATALFNGASASILRARQIPNCAATCIASADYGDCSPTDNVCLCNNQAFISSTASCIAGACQGDELQEANAASQALCAAVGVTLTSSVAAPTSTAPTSSESSGSDSSSSGSGSSSSGSSATSAADSSATSNTSTDNNGAISHSVNAFAGVVVIGAVAALL